MAVGGPPTVASPTAPVAPVTTPPPPPQPQKVAGRVIVPGATPPGKKKAAAPTAPTQMIARQDTAVAPRQAAVRAPSPAAPRPRVRRRRSGFRRFVTAVIALVLVIAVPVVSAYVSYKLASGENPFE